jgi:hypothetical protein
MRDSPEGADSVQSVRPPADALGFSPFVAPAPQASRSPCASSGAEHQLGILFVHGIGEQPEGETLLAFGEPLLRWLNRWLRRGGEETSTAGASVVHTLLTPSKLDEHVPPHAEVRIALPQSVADPASWLMAESWWGGDVQPPAFGKLAKWMMTVGAWIILSHISKGVLRFRHRASRIAMQVVAVLLWLVLASLFQLVVLTLSLFALLPIPGIRKTLSGILLAITGVLGDSYVLLESELQRSAIVNKTREALSWLAKRCDCVIVVAHSQGAALAHLALRTAEPRNVGSLVTFGSGLGKLEELLRLKEKPGRVHVIARLSPLFLLLFALLARIRFYEQWDELAKVAAFMLGMVIFGAAIYVIIVSENHWDAVEKWMPELKLASARPGLTWIDYHASHDLVSNGALSPGGARVATEDHEVRNLDSFFGDHTSYWDNRIEFVPGVLDAVAHSAGIVLFDAEDRKTLGRAAKAHRRTIRWLSITQWTTLVSVLLLPLLYWRELRARGEMVDAALGTIGGPVEKAMNALPALVTWLNPSLTKAVVNDVRLRVLGMLMFAAVILIWRLGYRFIWRWWDDRALEQVYRPGYLSHWADRGLVDAIGIAAGVAPLLVVAGLPFIKNLLIGHAIAGGILIIYAVTLALFVGRLAVQTAAAWPELRAGNRETWKEMAQRWAGLGPVLLVIGFILPAMFDELAPLRELITTGLMAVILTGVVVAMHRKVAARLGEMTQQRATRVTVMTLPTALAVAASVRTISVLTPPEMPKAAFELLIVPWSVYLYSLGAIYGVLWVIRRVKLRRVVG